MQADERQRRILARARANGRVDVGDVATELDVAPETIRRDLKLLDRRAGAAYARWRLSGGDRGLRDRPRLARDPARPEKRRIAGRGGTGSATRRRCSSTRASPRRSLPRPAHRPPADGGHRLAVDGRRLSPSRRTPRCCCSAAGSAPGTLATVGHWACSMLSGFVIDLAYLGANGISREFGLTTPDPAVADVKAKAVEVVPAARLRWGTTASSAPAASAGSPRSPTSRPSSPTPDCPPPRPTATPCSARRSSGSDRDAAFCAYRSTEPPGLSVACPQHYGRGMIYVRQNGHIVPRARRP